MEAKTENTLKQLWNLADARRGDRPLDALALLVQLAESGDRDSLTPELIDEIARTSFARHQMGNGFTAASVSHFFAALARTRPVDSILDPTCGSGLLMKQVADATGAKVVHGVEIDPRPLELARAVHGNGAEITLGDFFEVEPNLHRQYDLIIGDLPLGMTMRDPREITRKRFTASDLSEAITYWACEHLEKNGLAILNVTGRIVASERIRGRVNELDCAVTAAILVPSGVMLGTHIPTHLMLIEKGRQKQVFVAKLPEEQEQVARVVRNWQDRKQRGHPSHGSLVEAGGFRGYPAVEAARLLQEKIRGTGQRVVSSGELFVHRPQRVDRNEEEHLAESEDEVVIGPTGRVYLLNDPACASPNAFRVRVNLDVVHPPYLKRWMVSEHGKLALEAASSGNQRILSTGVLLAATYPLPDLATQRAIADLDLHLDRLETEIAEARTLLREAREPLPELQGRLDQINHDDEDLFWIETLPYPLASILWRHRTAGESALVRYPILEHFFEALATFLATIHLSAFTSDPDEWSKVQPRLLAGLQHGSLSFERASFGTWKTTHATLAKAVRALLGDDEQRLLACELYRSHDTHFLEAIADSRLASILDQACSLRNDLRGHGGAAGEAKASEHEAKLIKLLQGLRQVFGLHWRSTELVQPGSSEYGERGHRYEMPRLMGTRSAFERVERWTAEPMRTTSLYLLGQGEAEGLKLLPLFRMATSPSPTACYFLNRCGDGEMRHVSYHDENADDLRERFPETEEAVSRIKTLQKPLGADARA